MRTLTRGAPPIDPVGRRTGVRRAWSGAAAAVFALLAAAAPATALQVALPLRPLPGIGGCVRSALAPDLGGCPRTTPILDGAAGLALLDGGTRLAVAAPESDAVTFLTRTPGSGSLASGPCVSRAAVAACAAHAPGLGGAQALLASGGLLDVGSIDDRAVVALRGSTVVGCVAALAVRGCALRDPALAHVAALASSPDGRTIYAATYGDDPGADSVVALSQTNRSERPVARGRRGKLRRPRRPRPVLAPVPGPRGCVQSLGPTAATCAFRASGLQGLVGIAVSPDGRSVYTVSSVSSAIVRFVRNRSTGGIVPQECAGDASRVGAGDVPCAVRIAGLRGAAAVVVSPDGRFVYVASSDPGGVVTFVRNPASGSLSPVPGPDGCLSALPLTGCTTVPELRGARALALGPGGGELDVAAQGSNAVVVLRRVAGTGGLVRMPGPLTVISGWPGGIASLARFGPQLYATSPVDDGVIVLVRR
jgi:DNA-binding beta-propeller fold protein YncE